jgi:myo-inositol-1-phosphate synthase
MSDRLKESVPFVQIMPEAMTQDPESPGRIPEAGGHFAGGDVLHEKAA